MAVTQDNLKKRTVLHYGDCIRTIGPKGGERMRTERWRVVSQMKTWKTRPGQFEVKIRHGLEKSTYAVTQNNLQDFHLESDCAGHQLVINNRI